MAATGIALGIQLAEAAIPGIEALWQAIVNLRAKNPALTAAQVQAAVSLMLTTIGALDNDTLTQLAQIPSVQVAPTTKVGP